MLVSSFTNYRCGAIFAAPVAVLMGFDDRSLIMYYVLVKASPPPPIVRHLKACFQLHCGTSSVIVSATIFYSTSIV
jgi:hypothetical protein